MVSGELRTDTAMRLSGYYSASGISWASIVSLIKSLTRDEGVPANDYLCNWVPGTVSESGTAGISKGTRATSRSGVGRHEISV